MDQNQKNLLNISPDTTPTTPSPEVVVNQGDGHRNVGPIIATLVIVIVLIVAALYVFASRINREQNTPIDDTIVSNSNSSSNSQTTSPSGRTSNSPGSQTAAQSQTTVQQVQPVTGNSDDLQSLQNDLDKSTAGVDSTNF